ncbi:MAG: type II toxin-antitoxin system VapC family toxin [Nitrospiria bacterium]
MFTLDTNVIIYYFKRDQKVVPVMEDLFSKPSPIYVSVITQIELFSFPNLSEIESLKIENFLNIVSIVPVDFRLAQIAGQIRRLHRTKLADSIIAATALINRTSLITRNTGDFKKIPNLLLRSV